MQCPQCSLPLKMADRSGVEIDYCEKCRGVWLDRGELDKIIERAGQHMSGQHRDHDDDHDDDRHSTQTPMQGHSNHGARHRERENPMMELFDFF